MKLADRLKTKQFQLRVKQHEAVIDYVTGIEDVMKERELSQQGLATMLSKSRAWISKILRKKPNLTFFTAVEIADALGLKLRIDLEPRARAFTPIGIPRASGLDSGDFTRNETTAAIETKTAFSYRPQALAAMNSPLELESLPGYDRAA
jgi:transcriptional regulator with XRE-family HTH domain